jgi:flagellar biogenesis protein FliO
MKRSRPSKSTLITGHALAIPVIADDASLGTLHGHTGLLSRVWGWLRGWQGTRSTTRRLRVAETVSLGEKRFVAVVQVDGRHFLLAGGPTNIALLAQLDTQENFGEVLKKTLTTTPSKQVAKHKRPANAVMRAQVNPTNSPEDVPQTTVTARTRQRAKRSSRQDPFLQGTASAPAVTHLNGTKIFGDAGGQQGNRVGEQNSNSTTAQRGYFA